MVTNPPIGILGGTFDPIHFGHLRTALEIYQTFHLKEVRLVPCFRPVHRVLPVASPEDRLMMVKKAIHGEPALKADPLEIERGGLSYTIDTLRHFRAQFPRTPLCLILGVDALNTLTSWQAWEEITEIAHLIIAHRPQYTLPAEGPIATLLKEKLRQDPLLLHSELGGLIFLYPVTALDISSSDIRAQFSNQLNPRYLLPQAVYHYIDQNGIYRMNT